MNINEWGIRLWFSTGFDLSGATELQMQLTKPDGTVVTKVTPQVTAPAIDEDTTFGLFPANTYAEYITEPGDIDQTGQWSWRVFYTDLDKFLTSDVSTFVVNP